MDKTYLKGYKCTKCGVSLGVLTSYNCYENTCPPSSKSLLEEINKKAFPIENLDPDKRTWYYDDFGIRRKKEK